MRRTVHPLAVLLLAPVLLLTAVVQLLLAMWTEPAFDGLDEPGLAAFVTRVCPVDALLVMGAAQVVGVGTRAGRPAYALREAVATIAYRLGAFR